MGPEKRWEGKGEGGKEGKEKHRGGGGLVEKKGGSAGVGEVRQDD